MKKSDFVNKSCDCLGAMWNDIYKITKFKSNHNDCEMGLNTLHNGCQYLLFFSNNYGVSIVRHDGSYGYEQGLYELGVLWSYDGEDYHLSYDTPITDDVIGYLTIKEALDIADRVSKLTKDGKEINMITYNEEKIKEEKREVTEVLKSIRGCEGGDAYITAEDAQALDKAIKYLEG